MKDASAKKSKQVSVTEGGMMSPKTQEEITDLLVKGEITEQQAERISKDLEIAESIWGKGGKIKPFLW